MEDGGGEQPTTPRRPRSAARLATSPKLRTSLFHKEQFKGAQSVKLPQNWRNNSCPSLRSNPLTQIS